MRILLVAVNSKYIHTSLSVRTLSANAGGLDFIELTINEDITELLSAVYERRPDVICFSCYVWNIEYILKAASSLKSMLPEALIVFGGPEVSFCAGEILQRHEFVDAVIRGEGEETVAALAGNGFKFDGVRGVTYRGKNIIENPDAPPVQDLDSLVFPYTDEDLAENSRKLIYYESSRGCPYRCSYCLSSTEHSVRYKSVGKVKAELGRIIAAKPQTVKFTDRTFNSDAKRGAQLLLYMLENGQGITFHFELAAHTLTEEFMEIAARAPEGMFRFEIGLQSTNHDTLKAIKRSTELARLFKNVSRLTSMKNIHVHLDLIAGLPFEDYKSFGKSFNDAVGLRPTVLQLGFLKLLRGTDARAEAFRHGYKYRSYPPYEVIENAYISCGELLKLKRIEAVFDMYYNSGAFKKSVLYLERLCGNSFRLFELLAEQFENKRLFSVQLSRSALYEKLCEFAVSLGAEDLFFDLLKADYLTSNKNAVTPSWSLRPYNTELHKKRTEIIEGDNRELFSCFGDMPVRDILKRVHFEEFSYRVHDDCSFKRCVLAFSKSGDLLGEIIGY
ncbi:MAG: B12-binding domain-containing radical SAM protein [Clostridia bacterium]|nr:B12-binding domain-containing radical SAM protein [Clostridia bacterium]